MQGSRVRRYKRDRMSRQVSLEETRHQIENDSSTPWCGTEVDCIVCHEWDIGSRCDDDETSSPCWTMSRTHLNPPPAENPVDFG